MTSLRPENAQMRQGLLLAVTKFEEDFAESPAAAYLEDRGIGAKTARAHRIGYVSPDDPVEGWERFAGRICFPYLNFEKQPTWAKFRATPGMGDVKAKYAQQEGGRARLFNVQALSAPGDTLCLAEGEMDVVTLTALGLPAVGVPGATQWKPYMSRCLDGYRRVVLFYDDDDAGRGLVKSIRSKMPDVIPVAAPGGFKDIGEAYENGYGDAIRALAYGTERKMTTSAPSEPEAVRGLDGISSPDEEPPF